MALSNYERQKKWREKNRARYNLQRRNHRKNLSGVEKLGIEEPVEGGLSRKTEAFEGELAKASLTSNKSSVCPSPAQTSPKSKIEELLELVKMEQEKPRVEAPVALKRVYRSETGMVITKEQWEAREAEKSKARSKGFEIDEYAQT